MLNHKTGIYKRKRTLLQRFESLSNKVSNIVGSPYWFLFSIALIVIWIPSGLLIGFNEMWHLYINTTTTILTFLMMALLHTSQKKWERQMENRQKNERHTLKDLKQETEKIIDTIPTAKR
jgi:low affinity Fe/Cu permease